MNKNMSLTIIAMFILGLTGCFKDAVRVEARPDSLHFEENAVHAERGMVDVEPKAIDMEPKAVNVEGKVESGAVTVAPKAVSVEGTVESGAVTGNLNVRVASNAVTLRTAKGTILVEKEAIVLRIEKDAFVVHIDTTGLTKSLDNGVKELAYVFVAIIIIISGLVVWLIWRRLKADKVAADTARIAAENKAIYARQDLERAIAILPPDKAKDFIGFMGSKP